jgi:hypothetical protein
MIVGHFARRSHAQDFLQAMFSPQPTMSIPWVAGCHRETLFPLGKKTRFQKVVGCLDGIDSRQAQFLHQAILKRLE